MKPGDGTGPLLIGRDAAKLRLWKKSEVAEILGVCVRTVERLVAAGKLVVVTVNKAGKRIPSWSLTAYMKEIGNDLSRLQAEA